MLTNACMLSVIYVIRLQNHVITVGACVHDGYVDYLAGTAVCYTLHIATNERHGPIAAS